MDAAVAERTVSGTISKVRHYSEGTGFHVIDLNPDNGREPICLTFRGPRMYEGQHADATGSWETSPAHGRQFKATKVAANPPRTPRGTAIYLASGVIPGLGKTIAERATERFGNAVFEILDNEPERLAELRGVSPKKAMAWGSAWQKVEAGRRNAMAMLTSHGVTPGKAAKIHDAYRGDTERIVVSNPYDMAKTIRGISFEKADEVGRSVGIAGDNPFRVAACLTHVLDQASKSDGHTGLYRDLLAKRCANTLSITASEADDGIDAAIAEGTFSASAVDGRACIFLPRLFEAEASIARQLKAIADGPSPWRGVDADAAIAWVRPHLEHEPNAMQIQAIRTILAGKVTVLTGGPGTGKTFILKAIALIAERHRLSARQCALAGRAAQNMAEKTGRPADTIHMTLGQRRGKPGFAHNAANPLEAQVVTLDEGSMVNVGIAWSLIQAVKRTSALILVGDKDQLEPIGPGNFFEDVIRSGAVPIVRLTEITRQAKNSNIIVNAHRMNRGLMPIEDPSAPGQDFFFIEISDDDRVAETVVDLVRNRIPSRFGFDPVEDTLVLAPMKKGPAGTNNLNAHLRQALNPLGNATITSRDVRYQAGDKIMQTVNDYRTLVRNGEIGRIETIDVEKDQVRLRFSGDREVDGDSSAIATVVHGYAATGHKAQGTESDVVVVVVSMAHRIMLNRKIAYTMHTRGKRLVVFVGQRRALRFAIENANTVPRITKLRDWMRLAFGLPMSPA